MSVVPESLLLAAEERNNQLREVITKARNALEEGRHGDVRRILNTGDDKGLMTHTGVIAKSGGMA